MLVYIYYESLVVLQCCFCPFFSSTLTSCSWGYEHASIRSIISEFVTVSDSSKWTAERLFFRCGRIHETVQIVNQLTELTDWLKMTELTLFTFWLLKYYFIDVLTDKAEYGAKRNLAENLVKPFLIWEVRLCCESRYLQFLSAFCWIFYEFYDKSAIAQLILKGFISTLPRFHLSFTSKVVREACYLSALAQLLSMKKIASILFKFYFFFHKIFHFSIKLRNQ